MKRSIFIIAFTMLCFIAKLPAQKHYQNDTLLVFAVISRESPDTVGFCSFRTNQQIWWWDAQGDRHEGMLQAFTKNHIIVDGIIVLAYAVDRISAAKAPAFGRMPVPGTISQTVSGIKVNGIFNPMPEDEYAKLRRWFDFQKSHRVPEKIHGVIVKSAHWSSDSLRKAFEREEAKIAWEYAIKDSTRKQYDSLYHGTRYYSREYNSKRKNRRYIDFLSPHSITVSLFEPLANEATITYGYRLSRRFGFEISPGIYFSTSWEKKILPEPTFVQDCPGLSYDRTIRKGYQLNVCIKRYFLSKPNRYFALKFFGRCYNYNNERVLTWYEHYGNTQYYSIQSEKGWISGFAIMYGWQSTLFKHLTFDFHWGFGYFYRKGDVTELAGNSMIDQYIGNEPLYYPFTYTQEYWFPSIQAGVKIGYRFGKRKLKS